MPTAGGAAPSRKRSAQPKRDVKNAVGRFEAAKIASPTTSIPAAFATGKKQVEVAAAAAAFAARGRRQAIFAASAIAASSFTTSKPGAFAASSRTFSRRVSRSMIAGNAASACAGTTTAP